MPARLQKLNTFLWNKWINNFLILRDKYVYYPINTWGSWGSEQIGKHHRFTQLAGDSQTFDHSTVWAPKPESPSLLETVLSNICSWKMSERLWQEKKKSLISPQPWVCRTRDVSFKSSIAILSKTWIEWNFKKSLCLGFSHAPSPFGESSKLGRWVQTVEWVMQASV